MTKFVISGYIGFNNFGDEAIASVLTKYLKKINAEKIVLLSSNPEKTSKIHNVESINYLKFIKPIFETDILISGGGSLLQDITSLKSLIYYLLVIFTALLFHKKVIIFAQGFSKFRTKIGEFLTKIILKHCHKIYLRDLKSQEILKSLKINSIVIADPVFDIEIPPNINHSGIGIQLRNFENLSDEFLNLLADEISKNFKNEKINLYSLQDSLDISILIKFSNILKQKNIDSTIHNNLNIIDCINELTKLEYLIGMRFHANLIAAKARVKVLGINYDEKVKNLSTNIGFPIINLTDNFINNKFDNFINLDVSKYNIPIFIFPDIIEEDKQ